MIWINRLRQCGVLFPRIINLFLRASVQSFLVFSLFQSWNFILSRSWSMFCREEFVFLLQNGLFSRFGRKLKCGFQSSVIQELQSRHGWAPNISHISELVWNFFDFSINTTPVWNVWLCVIRIKSVCFFLLCECKSVASYCVWCS